MSHQIRIDRYFGIPQTYVQGKPPLLDLPSNIRSHIFSYLNLVRNGHLHLNFEKEDDNSTYKPLGASWGRQPCCDRHKLYDVGYCVSASVLASLLVCRTLYREISSILYSCNHFVISRTCPGGLRGLFSLNATTLASLTSLTIALNKCKYACPYHSGQGCYDACETCEEWKKETPLKPLGYASRNDKSIIREWSDLCKHIAQSIQPHQLQLCLMCDVRDIETAERITQPMLQLPPLSACCIRLSTRSNTGLRQLAKKTAQHITRQSPSRSVPSQLPYLPHEIQAQILQYTELTAPYDLEWRPKQGLVCRPQGPHDFDVSRRGPRASNPCELCFGFRKDCYEHIAAERAAWALQCSCWRLPLEYFLVSRRYHREATRILFSSNHFHIMLHGNRRCTPHVGEDFSLLIQQLPCDSIQYLRSLQFCITDPDCCFKLDTRDWAQCIDNLARYANLSRLSITIDKSAVRHWPDPYGTVQQARETDESIWKQDQRIAETLVKLTGLRDLFVHLATPIISTIDSSSLTNLRLEREKVIERLVMGDRYDSHARGKFSHRHRFMDWDRYYAESNLGHLTW